MANILPDWSADLGLLLVAHQFGVGLLVGLLGLFGVPVSNRPLPLLGFFDLLFRLGALLLGHDLALLFFDIVADSLCGLMALVLCDRLAVLWRVAHPLGFVNTIGPATLFVLNMAEGHRYFKALVDLDEPAFFLSSRRADFVPDGLAIINSFVGALVMVLSAALLVNDFIHDSSTLQLVIFLI